MSADRTMEAPATLAVPSAGPAVPSEARAPDGAGLSGRGVWLLRLLLVASTTVLPLAIGKLVIPLEWYAFRCWEVLIDYRPAGVVHGPLYANQVLHKVEVGDLGVRSRYAVPKVVEWQTDAYGYRNRPAAQDPRYHVVLVGRSDVAGNSLTQADALTEVLKRQTGYPIYGYAPASLDEFLREPRFVEASPAAVVYINTERGLYELAPLKAGVDSSPSPPQGSLITRVYCRVIPKPMSLAIDRVRKKPWLSTHFYRVLTHQPNYPFVVDQASGMLFYKETLQQDERYRHRRDLTERAIATVKAYRDAVVGRGMRFIFMPVPDKETVYWDLIPETAGVQPERPAFLQDLVSGLRRAGVDVVDLAPAYRWVREAGGQWTYHLDDTHWNPLGVTVAAGLLAQELRNADAL